MHKKFFLIDFGLNLHTYLISKSHKIESDDNGFIEIKVNYHNI